MNSVEQRRDEIFRRSKQRILARKRRRRQCALLAAPLLVTAVLIVLFSPKGSYKALEDVLQPSVAIIHEGQTFTVDKADHVAALRDAVDQAFSHDLTHPFHDYSTSTTRSKKTPYTAATVTHTHTNGNVVTESAVTEIAFTDEKGRTIVYRLAGNTLCNTATEESVLLTAQELAALSTLLAP